MNAQAAYLAWLRNTAPEVYSEALRRAFKRPRGLNGLSDDLVQRMFRPSTGFGFLGDDTLDTITVTADATPDGTDIQSLVVNPDTLTISPASLTDNTVLPMIPEAPASGDTLFSQVANAVAGVATAALKADSQSNLLRLNTQRAQQGLPPVDANGVPIRSSLLAPSTNPALRNIEATISGAASSPLVWVAGLGLLAFLLLRRT